MRRLVLHLLLALTLVLNGIAVPWAMARMNHAGHGFALQREAAGATRHAASAHAQHDTATACDGARAPAQQDAPSADPGRSCCDGSTCACGCVLPPALSVPVLAAADTGIASIISVPPARRTPPGHDTPPFRPPAA